MYQVTKSEEVEVSENLLPLLKMLKEGNRES
jgi:hypothetical protein